MRIEPVPVTIKEAKAFVKDHHRHSNVPAGACFAVGAAVDGKLVGVALAGRPVARMLQDGVTLEALRVCTDGTRNACSFLYARVIKAGRALGYRRFVTYTLTTEGGASLRGAGWKPVAEVRARGWSRPKRYRTDEHEIQARIRWEPAHAD